MPQQMTQMQIFQTEAKRIGERDRAFMDMVNHPTNPMTNKDLSRLVERRPDVYGRYSGFVGKLNR